MAIRGVMVLEVARNSTRFLLIMLHDIRCTFIKDDWFPSYVSLSFGSLSVYLLALIFHCFGILYQ